MSATCFVTVPLASRAWLSLFFLCCQDCIVSIVLSFSSLILSSVLSIMLLNPSIQFSYFSCCIFSVLKFPFDSSVYILRLCREFLYFLLFLFQKNIILSSSWVSICPIPVKEFSWDHASSETILQEQSLMNKLGVILDSSLYLIC